MDDGIENVEKVVQYWIESAEQNHSTMQNLLKTRDNSWALFMGHLVLEKLLKAHYVKKNKKHAFFTHDLLRLSVKSGVELSDEYADWLDSISAFNINARYDNYKNDFFKLCTSEFTMMWVGKIEILKQWLINQL